ncbi:major strawberry allergen Fra a 1-E-like [Phragmites australis]|uniref:major strawberry allergen Fra a 1-E-like n=1 Tax=Phragmites australis TaxID=29695 RepID=UPI002D77A9A9|nr:major strawberry allergen Fra a 1-E-like [Phragmites australis]
MKSLQGEVQLNIPATKAWEIFTNNETVAKINPEMLAGAEYLEGDGSPGSLRLFRLGPALHHFVKESVQKIEKIESGRCLGYEVIRGELKEMYDPYHVTVSFIPVPGKEGEQCIATWKAEFEPISPTTPMPENAKDAALGFLKLFETCGASD